jgi:hypothetical protein
VGMIERGDITGAVDAAMIKAEVDRALVESGFYTESQDLIEAGYTEAMKGSYEQYKVMYRDKFRFSDSSMAKLDALKQLDFGRMGALAETLSMEVSRVVLGTTMGAVNKREAIERIRGILDKQIGGAKVAGYAQTFVQDGLMSFYNTANTQLAMDNGITQFEYVGTLIKTSRDFCVEHVGQVHTLEEWDRIAAEWDIPVGPFYERRGGYNCRHSLVGVA